MRNSYPSDITREQFSKIEPLLLSARKITAPRKIDLYDAGKKVSGIKRHIAVDTQGLPHAIHITTANVSDRDGAVAMIECAKNNLSSVLNILVDGGYTGEKFAEKIKSVIGATVEVAKRSELHKFVVIPQRWVVERSFAWLEKCRRLWKNCERKTNTSLQMVVLAFLTLLLKRL